MKNNPQMRVKTRKQSERVREITPLQALVIRALPELRLAKERGLVK